MYETHQPIIQQYVQSDPQRLADVVIFAIATANQHFHRIPQVIRDIRTCGIARSTWLSARRRHAAAYITAHASHEYHTANDAYLEGGDIYLLTQLVQLPGLGFVKAGFVAQLVWGRIGCLDVHNMRVLGLDRPTFNKIPTSAEYLMRRAQSYISACRQLGSPQEMWDGWVRLIYAKYPDKFESAEHVSRIHVECIVRSEEVSYAN